MSRTWHTTKYNYTSYLELNRGQAYKLKLLRKNHNHSLEGTASGYYNARLVDRNGNPVPSNEAAAKLVKTRLDEKCSKSSNPRKGKPCTSDYHNPICYNQIFNEKDDDLFVCIKLPILRRCWASKKLQPESRFHPIMGNSIEAMIMGMDATNTCHTWSSYYVEPDWKYSPSRKTANVKARKKRKVSRMERFNSKKKMNEISDSYNNNKYIYDSIIDSDVNPDVSHNTLKTYYYYD